MNRPINTKKEIKFQMCFRQTSQPENRHISLTYRQTARKQSGKYRQPRHNMPPQSAAGVWQVLLRLAQCVGTVLITAVCIAAFYRTWTEAWHTAKARHHTQTHCQEIKWEEFDDSIP